MKKSIFTFLFLFCVSISYSQWTANYGFSDSDINFTNAKGNAVTTDAYGFSYVTGNTSEGINNDDIITIKYSSAGDTEWVRSYNGTANLSDEGKGICIDANGNVYVTGSVQNLNKGYDIVILKYNSRGDFVWSREYTTPGINSEDKAWGIVVDTEDNIFITGYGTTSNGFTRIVTQKYLSNGDLTWTTYDENSIGDSKGLAIAVNSTGVYVTGYVPAGNSTDIVLLKYSKDDGSPIYRTLTGGSGEDKAWGIVVDETDNVYITGYVTTSANNTDSYTAKFNSAGTFLWSQIYNGGGSDKAWGIVVDTDGSIYIAGETSDISGNVDYLTVKYSATGTQMWVQKYNGTGNGEDKAASIALLYTGNVVVTGKSWGTSLTYDYATLRYNSNSGDQTGYNRYSFSGISNDIAKDVAISPSNKVIITGFSQIIIENGRFDNAYISTQSIDFGSDMESEPTVPKNFSLYQNYPNPFNPSTSIKFDLVAASQVKLAIFDMLGREVNVLVNQQLGAGTHNISFNAGNLSSGIYFYKLETGSFSAVKKMTLVK